MHPTDPTGFDEPQVVPGVLVLQPDRREITRAWVRLWVAYNGVMLVAGTAVLLMCSHVFSNPVGAIGAIYGSVIFGVLANACFTLGPIAEFLIVALYSDEAGREARPRLFVAGLLLSLLVVAAVGVMLALMPAAGMGGGFNDFPPP
ncbi:MAG: hypothetical protein AB7K09_24520 [Planctomycetota bacterium]